MQQSWIDRTQYAYSGPMRRDVTPIRWTEDLQGWAVQQGLFVARCKHVGDLDHANQAIIVTLPTWKGASAPADCVNVLSEIERKSFLCEPNWHTLWRFIRQQDLHRYPHGWDRSVEDYSPHLRWYKLWRARKSVTTGVNRASPYEVALVKAEEARLSAIKPKRAHTLASRKEARQRASLADPDVQKTLAWLAAAQKDKIRNERMMREGARALSRAQAQNERISAREGEREGKRRLRRARTKREAREKAIMIARSFGVDIYEKGENEP